MAENIVFGNKGHKPNENGDSQQDHFAIMTLQKAFQ